MRQDIREKWIDYFTVAGLVVFAILGIVYLNLDRINSLHIDVSLQEAAASLPVPGLPNISLDWYYAMDPVSKLIFSFLTIVLVSSLIGSVVLLVARKRAVDRK